MWCRSVRREWQPGKRHRYWSRSRTARRCAAVGLRWRRPMSSRVPSWSCSIQLTVAAQAIRWAVAGLMAGPSSRWQRRGWAGCPTRRYGHSARHASASGAWSAGAPAAGASAEAPAGVWSWSWPGPWSRPRAGAWPGRGGAAAGGGGGGGFGGSGGGLVIAVRRRRGRLGGARADGGRFRGGGRSVRGGAGVGEGFGADVDDDLVEVRVSRARDLPGQVISRDLGQRISQARRLRAACLRAGLMQAARLGGRRFRGNAARPRRPGGARFRGNAAIVPAGRLGDGGGPARRVGRAGRIRAMRIRAGRIRAV